MTVDNYKTELPRKEGRKRVTVRPIHKREGILGPKIELEIGSPWGGTSARAVFDLEEVTDLMTILAYHYSVLTGAICEHDKTFKE